MAVEDRESLDAPPTIPPAGPDAERRIPAVRAFRELLSRLPDDDDTVRRMADAIRGILHRGGGGR